STTDFSGSATFTLLGSQPTVTITGSCPTGADLSITKSDAPDPVSAGGTLTYTLTVSNGGPSTATSVSVTDTLPAGVTFQSASGTGWTCSGTNASVTCTRASLAPTGGTPSTITIVVTAPNEGGTIINTAAVSAATSDPNPANNTATASTTVTASADLSIIKTDSPDPVFAGGTLTYTLSVSNAGPSTATTVSVTDTLPAGVTFQSASGTGWACSGTNASVTCTRASLAPTGGTPSTITITVTAPNEGGTISNTASVGASTSDPNTANNSATEQTTVIASADVKIDKTGPPTIDAGTSFAYTLTVTNLGPSTATQIQVTDQPGGATVTAVSASGGGFSCGFNTTTNTASCSGGTLSKAAVATITLTVTAPNEGGPITNAATVLAHEVDSNPANNLSATVTTMVRAVADLSITKSASPDPVRPGGILTYTVSVANAGPSAAANVRMDDLLPSQTTFRSVTSPASWTCTTPMTGTVTCTTPSLASGATATFTLAVQVSATALDGSTISNTATVSSATFDSNTGNNSATATTTVRAADLAITKSAPTEATSGTDITYLLSVTNNGPTTSSGGTVTDILPAGVSFKSASAGCTPGTGTVTCSFGTLVSGSSVSFYIVVHISV